MSANLKVANFDSDTLTYKIVSDTTLTNVPNVDVTASSGVLLSGIMHNQGNAVIYIKISLTATTVTVGTTVPDLTLMIPSGQSIRLTIPGGVAFTKLSFWSADAPTTASNASTPTPIVVSFITT